MNDTKCTPGAGLLPSERFAELWNAVMKDKETAAVFAEQLFEQALARSKATGSPMPAPEEVEHGIRWAMLFQVLDERLGRAPASLVPTNADPHASVVHVGPGMVVPYPQPEPSPAEAPLDYGPAPVEHLSPAPGANGPTGGSE